MFKTLQAEVSDDGWRFHAVSQEKTDSSRLVRWGGLLIPPRGGTPYVRILFELPDNVRAVRLERMQDGNWALVGQGGRLFYGSGDPRGKKQ